MITLTDVHKAFGDNRVLRGVTVEIPTGTSLVVIGGSGTGKSVMLKCVLGLVTPESGTITVDGQDAMRQTGTRFWRGSGCCFRAAPCLTRCPSGRTSPFD